MKKEISFLLLAGLLLLNGCGIFKPGCGCPKVSAVPVKTGAVRNV